MHILITDDYFTNRFQLGMILRNLGHTYDEAGDGEQALNQLSQHDYDLIFMDIEMPVRNGIETVQHIRNELSPPQNQIPVVALSAHESEEYTTNVGRAGFSAWIGKPITQDKIANVIETLFKSSRSIFTQDL